LKRDTVFCDGYIANVSRFNPMAMKYGFVLPSGDARTAANFAREAESACWDGFFVWEGVWAEDAWVMLAACAMTTEKIRLGTLLTPPTRRRPHKLASETSSVDRLSNGRLILSVGLGAPHENSGWEEFGEITERKTRAERMDESLEILTRLWQGEPFEYKGKHFRAKIPIFSQPPPPVQKPRIPIWVVGAVNREKSLRRVLKYDGLLPTVIEDLGNASGNFTPDQLRAAIDWLNARREIETPLDVIVENQTPGDNPKKAREIIKPFMDAGATWHIESMWDTMGGADGQERVLKRIKQGPSKVE
jgi:alkanesulfonate monooxygenase SsuD/methylene tetrahydromethanopterin reductase-like flavin-dependent oxidoreductase (luciferase family)